MLSVVRQGVVLLVLTLLGANEPLFCIDLKWVIWRRLSDGLWSIWWILVLYTIVLMLWMRIQTGWMSCSQQSSQTHWHSPLVGSVDAVNPGLPETGKRVNHWNYNNYGTLSLFASFRLRHGLPFLSQQPRDKRWEQSELLWCLAWTPLFSLSGPHAAVSHIKAWVIYQMEAQSSPGWCASVSDCVAARFSPLFAPDIPVLGALQSSWVATLSRQWSRLTLGIWQHEREEILYSFSHVRLSHVSLRQTA